MAAPNTRASAPKSSQASLLIKVETLKGTMKLISRVMQKCEEEIRVGSSIQYDDPIGRAVRYTGLHEDVISNMSSLLRSGSETIMSVTMEDIDPMLIRNVLMNFYLNEEVLPTTQQLFNALQTKIPVSVDIRTLRKTLLKMNYMWKHIPNNNLVIVERPSSIFERYHYLKRIIEYREENRSIIYLDVSLLNSKGDIVMMTNAEDPEITKEESGYFMYGVSRHQVYGLTVKQASPFTKEIFEEWIRDIISFHVPPNSVIIMNNLDYNNEEIKKLPNIDSFKAEMIEWLEYHNVPCSPSMCKVELFSLIEKFTNAVDKLYKIDKILKVYGHDVLRVPSSIVNVTLTCLVRSLVMSNYRATPDEPIDVDQSWDKFESARGIFNKLYEKLLNEFDDYIENEEKAIFYNDMKLDEKFDQLCEEMSGRVCNSNDEDSDIPTLSDSD